MSECENTSLRTIGGYDAASWPWRGWCSLRPVWRDMVAAVFFLVEGSRMRQFFSAGCV